jgi:glycosyltransferase involved in cell wall biosynthesis
MRVVLDVRVLRGTGGGPEKTLTLSYHHLKRYDYHMVCAYLCDPTDTDAYRRLQEMRERGVEVAVIPDCGPFDLRVVAQLKKIIRHIRPHIYHAHDYKSHVLGALLGRPSTMVRAGTLHGWVDRNTKLDIYYCLEKASLSVYDRIYCVSPQLYQEAKRCRVSPQALRYLPNGIDIRIYKRLREPFDARKELGLEARGIWIGAVARLAKEKNLDVVLKTAAQLLLQGYPIYCLFVGEGPLRAFLESEARLLGLTRRVYFAGYQHDVRPWLECMDVYLCTSLREGMPNSILEAMAMEVPVIATKVGAIPNMIRHCEDGMLVPCNDVSAIVQAVRQILDDRTIRDKMVKSARARVAREFSFERRTQLLAADYDRLIAKARG